MLIHEQRFNDFTKLSQKDWPKIKGAFVSIILEKSGGFHRAKTLDQWKLEISAMMDIGIEYIIVQTVAGYNNVNGESLSALFPTTGNVIKPYMNQYGNQIDFIFEASTIVAKLRNKPPIKIWLGTISGFGENNKNFDTTFNLLMSDLFVYNKYQQRPNWGGLYLSNERAILKRIDKITCQQTIEKGQKNWPNWLEYSKMILAAKRNGYNGPISISPVYRPAASPYADIPKTCKGRWVTTNILNVVDAKSALTSMINDSNCLSNGGLTDVWIQDGLGFRWLKDAYQVCSYFAGPNGFTQVKLANINYNMECFKSNNPSSCTPGIITKPWAELYVSFRAAYASGYNSVCVYEWFTNWSPYHTEVKDPNKIFNYTKYKSLL